MYPHSVTRFSPSADFLGSMPSPDAGSAPPMCCQYQLESDVSHNSYSSGCTSYGSPSSLTSYRAQGRSESVMQRSISSHSLHMRSGAHNPVSASFADFLKEAPVRKAYSAGDLQVPSSYSDDN